MNSIMITWNTEKMMHVGIDNILKSKQINFIKGQSSVFQVNDHYPNSQASFPTTVYCRFNEKIAINWILSVTDN